jgi:hypothetical protein
METNTGTQGPSQKYQGLIYSALVVFSVGGIAIMDFSVKYGLWYWLAMAVLFGVVSTIMAWKKDQDLPGDQSDRVRKQGLHWATLVVGILLVFLMQDAVAFAPANAGLTALLMLAVTAVLAGIHFNWRMAVVGLILGATFVAAVLAEEFFWPLLAVAFVAVAVIWAFRRKGS